MNLFLSIKNRISGKLRVTISLIFHPNLFPIIMSWPSYQNIFYTIRYFKNNENWFLQQHIIDQSIWYWSCGYLLSSVMQNINMTGGITRIFWFQTFYGMFNSQICKIYQARRMAASKEKSSNLNKFDTKFQT